MVTFSCWSPTTPWGSAHNPWFSGIAMKGILQMWSCLAMALLGPACILMTVPEQDACGGACCAQCTCCSANWLEAPYCAVAGGECVNQATATSSLPPSASSSSGQTGGWGAPPDRLPDNTSRRGSGPIQPPPPHACISTVERWSPAPSDPLPLTGVWARCSVGGDYPAFNPEGGLVLEVRADNTFQWMTVATNGKVRPSQVPWFHGAATAGAPNHTIFTSDDSVQHDVQAQFFMDRALTHGRAVDLVEDGVHARYVETPPLCARDGGMPGDAAQDCLAVVE